MSKVIKETAKGLHTGTIRVIVIIACYIVLYCTGGLICALMNKSTISFIIIEAIACFFGFKFFKDAFSGVSSLPGIVVVLVLAGVAGVFVAPYYIGKKIANLIIQSSWHQAINDTIDGK